MKYRSCWFLVFFVCSLNTLNAQIDPDAVNRFLNNSSLRYASVGIYVKDISGESIVSYNADKALTPASTLKVITTATALELLGPEYRYNTTLGTEYENPKKILVKGYGDPTLGTEHLDNIPNLFLEQWVDAIKRRVNNSDSLDILVVDNYFGYVDGISLRWTYQNLGNYYAAGAYGISIYDNTYKLFFNTIRQDTCPVIIRTEPKVDINFKNTLKLNASGQDDGYIHGEPFSKNRLLTGSIPASRSSFSIKGDIPNPGLLLGEVLADRLQAAGYKIRSIETTYNSFFEQMYQKPKPILKDSVFYTHQSFPLKDIIKDTNVRSNNHYAEQLIRTIGRTMNDDIYTSALDLGIERTKSFWKDKGLDADALMMFDGSGLSPVNAFTPKFMCDLLTYMLTESKYKAEFLESLPEAGKEGTVRNRLKNTKLVGKVRMKSGSIHGVQCFAGYYIDGDKKYAFTIMVNKFAGSTSELVKSIDRLLLDVLI